MHCPGADHFNCQQDSKRDAILEAERTVMHFVPDRRFPESVRPRMLNRIANNYVLGPETFSAEEQRRMGFYHCKVLDMTMWTSNCGFLYVPLGALCEQTIGDLWRAGFTVILDAGEGLLGSVRDWHYGVITWEGDAGYTDDLAAAARQQCRARLGVNAWLALGLVE